MKEEIKLLIQKIAEDKELQHKMMECKSPEEAYAIASSVQDGFTFEEFVDAMTKLYDSMSQNAELTDEDLAKAAGGLTSGEEISLGVTITVTMSAVFAGAAF